MAVYGYVAIDKSGKEIKGSVEGDSEERAAQEVKRQGMILLELTNQNFMTKDLDLQIGGKPTPRDLSVFCRSFVSMTKAGVTILEALKMLTDQTENKRLKKAAEEVRISVEKGETFANSLAEHPKEFPSLLINMAAAGEASGSLDTAMFRMALQFEKSAKTKALVKKAMVYPIVVALVAVGVVVLMLTVVIPSYTEMFAELGTELPLITVMVVNASNFMTSYWFILLPLVILLAAGIKAYTKTPSGEHLVGKLALTIPAVKNLVTKSASAQFARTMSTLLAAGVPMVEAVETVSGTMENIWFKEALLTAKEDIIAGVPLSQPLEESGLFPPMVYHMTRIGEESGSTEEMLDRLADYYDEEVEMAVQTLMAAMEPAIIIVLACIVGVLIASVMAPMVSMYSALDSL